MLEGACRRSELIGCVGRSVLEGVLVGCVYIDRVCIDRVCGRPEGWRRTRLVCLEGVLEGVLIGSLIECIRGCLKGCVRRCQRVC